MRPPICTLGVAHSLRPLVLQGGLLYRGLVVKRRAQVVLFFYWGERVGLFDSCFCLAPGCFSGEVVALKGVVLLRR